MRWNYDERNWNASGQSRGHLSERKISERKDERNTRALRREKEKGDTRD